MGYFTTRRIDLYTPGGYTSNDMKHIVNRVKRIEGQLQKLRTELDAGTACDVLVPQVLAIKGAVDSCVEAYLLDSLQACSSKKSSAEMALLLKTIIKKI